MITNQNMLICLFSYNLDNELKVLLESVENFAPDFDMIIFDDASTNHKTHQHLSNYKHLFKEQFLLPKEEKKKSTRGRLHHNIQASYEYALNHGYKYLFMIQDDMQFVRPLNQTVLTEYSNYFAKSEDIIEVDPRFLRRLGDIVIDEEINGYFFDRTDDRRSYADVGILCLERLKAVEWSFELSERKNKVKAHEKGFKRVFPFTPIFMHLPYPVIYRKGKRKNKFPSPFVRRGHAVFEYMTAEEIQRMDKRNIKDIPYARDLLKPKNLGLASLHYKYADEGRVFA